MEEGKNTVPLRKVVLYKHGMGYFERSGSADGNTKVEILCGASDIDDMLKSLMVLTTDGARVDAITYDSAKTLEDRMLEFGFDIRSAKGLIDIISQMKGLPVTITVSGASTSGRVVGIDFADTVVENNHTVREAFLVVLNGATFKRTAINSISSITVDDGAFSTELNQQLELLFQNAKKKDKKALVVSLPETKGEIVIAYSIPTPIWKTSYRLIWSEQRLMLQGMAIVDNTQDEDWQDVKMVLVSAAPISFIQPLYDPVQPYRQTIATQGYTSSGPVVAERGSSREDSRDRCARSALARGGALADKESWGAMAMAAPAAPMMAMQAGGAGGAAQYSYDSSEGYSVDAMMTQTMASNGELPVDTGSSGEHFEYRIQNPVTVPRNSSALIPIVQQDVEGERISLFNMVKHMTHPYSTIKLKNTTRLTLESGPVTVMEEGAYAGEALLDVLKPDDERMLPFALDQDCHFVVRDEHKDMPVWRVRLINGTMFLDYRTRSSTLYRVENVGDKTKIVYVEHPVNPGANLVGDAKPIETTQHYYRFKTDLEPKQVHELAVQEEQEVERHVWISHEQFDYKTVNWVIGQRLVEKELAESLKTLIQKHQELSELAHKQRSMMEEINQYVADQQRARENLKALGSSNERYRQSLDEAEDKIATAQAEVKTLDKTLQQKRREFIELARKQLESELAS
jgi:hypothetical protein